MTLSNYPPGMKNSDIPGWFDIEKEIEGRCESCGFEGSQFVTTDNDPSKSTHLYEWECPKCGVITEGEEDDDIEDDGGDFDDDVKVSSSWYNNDWI
jgi:predicted RNA-binding Zn-ribbon protein involved in translation (DUF1610 family)